MCYKIYNTESGVQKRGPVLPILVEDLLKTAIFADSVTLGSDWLKRQKSNIFGNNYVSKNPLLIRLLRGRIGTIK